MKSLVIAAAALGMVLAGDSADARRRNRTYVQQTPVYTYAPAYTTNSYSTTNSYRGTYYRGQSQRMGFFQSIMEFERRKNAFLFGR